MKLSSVLKKLRAIATETEDAKGNYVFKSRASSHRLVKLYRQGGESVVALPICVQYDGADNVAFHAKTIKSLVEFLSE